MRYDLYSARPLLRDSYNILEPKMMSWRAMPNIKLWIPAAATDRPSVDWGYHINNAVKSLMHSVRGTVTMKMLAVYADGREHHWSEVNPAIGIPVGNDIDCWRSLVNRKLIAFSSKHKYGRKFYTITEFGRDILNVIEANHVFYRIARWFKLKGDIYSKLLMADVNSTESPITDLTPENFLALVKALFDPSSKINEIGSAYKWMNSFVFLTKTSRDFYEQFYTPEVVEWLNTAQFSSVKRFLPILTKAKKKWEKKGVIKSTET